MDIKTELKSILESTLERRMTDSQIVKILNTFEMKRTEIAASVDDLEVGVIIELTKDFADARVTAILSAILSASKNGSVSFRDEKGNLLLEFRPYSYNRRTSSIRYYPALLELLEDALSEMTKMGLL